LLCRSRKWCTVAQRYAVMENDPRRLQGMEKSLKSFREKVWEPCDVRKARFPFKRNRLRCVNENRKKRKRLLWQAVNHGYHCFDRAFLLAGACVFCVKISRNKRKRLRLNGNRALDMIAPCVCRTDVDECELVIHNCHEYAKCYNALGGFTCECPPHFAGDGISCTGAPPLHVYQYH